jgi:hypothetical protein
MQREQRSRWSSIVAYNPKDGWAFMAPPVPLIPRSDLTAVVTAEFPDVSENGARRRTETMKADARFVHAGPHS